MQPRGEMLTTRDHRVAQDRQCLAVTQASRLQVPLKALWGLRNPDTLDKGHFSHTDTGFPLARSKWLA